MNALTETILRVISKADRLKIKSGPTDYRFEIEADGKKVVVEGKAECSFSVESTKPTNSAN